MHPRRAGTLKRRLCVLPRREPLNPDRKRDPLAYLRWRAQTTWPLRPLYRLLNPNWYRRAVGVEWEETGKALFRFLKEHGLKPDHYFLDVGCGSLRVGVHLVGYLEAGHYYGVDKDGGLLDAGRRELRRHGIQGKRPTLVPMRNFDYPSLDQAFDFALANSVFTHLPLNDVLRCLVNIERVLRPSGRFFASFFESPDFVHLTPLHHRSPEGYELDTYFDRDPYHQSFELLSTLCEGTGLRVQYLGEWKAGGTQRMLVFARRGSKA